MNIVKKLSAGAWIALVAAVLSLVSLIAYIVNISSEGYFQNASVTNLALFCVLAIILLVAAVALGQLRVKGAAATVVEIISGIMQIAAPVLLTFCLINLIAARAQGLSFIYLSNEDVIKEVQTAANLSSATGTIVNMVCLVVAVLAGVVGAFCNPRKKAA